METVDKSLLNSSNVDVFIDSSLGNNCMHFKFKEKFSKEASLLATKAWSNEFESNPNSDYTHVWNCTEMKDFDYSARDEWMQTLTKYSNRITHVSLISNSLIIRGAARIMSKFSNLNLHVHKSIDELNH